MQFLGDNFDRWLYAGAGAEMAVENRSAARLAEIAAVLRCPVETFFVEDNTALDIRMTYELMSLWNSVRQPHLRQRILDILRRELDLDVPAPEAAE